MITQTSFSRRIDTSGRLVIPSRLRSQLGIESGQEFDFFVIEEDGREFLAIEYPERQERIKRALELLREEGYTIT